MRGTLAAALFLSGATLMTATETDAAQAKKDDKFPDKVTVRRWIASQKEFLDPIKDVKANFKEVKDRKVWRLHAGDALTTPEPGSEITDKDGAVWVVRKVNAGPPDHICDVEKKEPAKKKD